MWPPCPRCSVHSVLLYPQAGHRAISMPASSTLRGARASSSATEQPLGCSPQAARRAGIQARSFPATSSIKNPIFARRWAVMGGRLGYGVALPPGSAQKRVHAWNVNGFLLIPKEQLGTKRHTKSWLKLRRLPQMDPAAAQPSLKMLQVPAPHSRGTGRGP